MHVRVAFLWQRWDVLHPLGTTEVWQLLLGRTEVRLSVRWPLSSSKHPHGVFPSKHFSFKISPSPKKASPGKCRQGVGNRWGNAETHFEELVKTCRFAELFLLEMPKLGLDHGVAQAPLCRAVGAAPLHASGAWAGSGGSEENAWGGCRNKWVA